MTYDRAGNMAGKKKSGVSSRILKLNDKELYMRTVLITD